MKKIFILILCLFSTFLGLAQSSEEISKRLKGIDKELENVLSTWKAAGFAVAVVHKNQVIYAKGFGYRDYEKKIPVSPNTLFAIGSCSKAFTSSLLGILEKEGKLSLDESPIKYIPELRFFNDEMNQSIIIRDLMCHRTGLPRHDFSWYLFPSYSKDSLIQRIAYQEPFAGVREKWYYNNFMFLAQGVIVEKITGKSWEENISEKLFKPLGMTTSNLTIDDLKKSKEAALGYQLKNNETIEKTDYYKIAAMGPAGSINSSVNEMTNWLITWIYGGKFKDKEIIPAAYVNQAMSSQMVVTAGLPGKERPDLYLANYGLGWFISSYKGHYRVEHGGNIDGFSANTCFFPSDSLGIVVLVNQDGSSVPGVVRNIIADKVLNVSLTDWNKELKEERDKAIQNQKEAQASSTSDKKSDTKPSHILAEFTGIYSHPGYGSFELLFERDSLFARFPIDKFWLKHVHYDIFEPFEVTKTGIDTTDALPRLNFITNEIGEISGLRVKLEPAIEALEFKRKPSKFEVSKALLEKYVGEYELSGITVKVYIKGEETLYVLVPGQPEYELYPIDLHKFSIKILDGYKVEFVEGDDKKIASLSFIQPNGTFKATKK